jgi:hypothetical protein
LNTAGAETQRKTEKGRGRAWEDTALMYLCVLCGEKFDAIALFKLGKWADNIASNWYSSLWFIVLLWVS